MMEIDYLKSNLLISWALAI